MAGKKMIPAPIDRPLSRAYLREFTGWSTAYPPGISDPTSLRLMENVMIQRDGACRVRPGLRYLSYSTAPADDGSVPGNAILRNVVGTHEPFFLANGTKAYLFAVRETDGTVGFRVLANTGLGMTVRLLTATGVEFDVSKLTNFSAKTTYVKYLQIDNKVFALSDAGETMRLFQVGSTKTAKTLQSVTRPNWSVADKLTVVHPTATWVTDSSAATYRTNYVKNPNFERSTDTWLLGGWAEMARSTAQARTGTYSLRVASIAQRTNLIKNPAVVAGLGTYGINEWSAGYNTTGLTNTGGIKADIPSKTGGAGRRAYIDSSKFDVEAGKTYRVSHDLTQIGTNTESGTGAHGVKVRFYNTSGAQIGSDRDIDYGTATGRKNSPAIPAPSGAAKMTVHPWVVVATQGGTSFTVANWVVCLDGESTAAFYGASGTNYFWTGTAGRSASVYHPPSDITLIGGTDGGFPGAWSASAYVRSTVVRNVDVSLNGTTSAPAATSTSTWTRFSVSPTLAAGTTGLLYSFSIRGVARGETHYIDDVQVEQAAAPTAYFDGDAADTSTKFYTWSGAKGASSSLEATYAVGGSAPPAATKTADTLISSTKANNVFNFGFFYTFNTEIGESAASQVTVVRAQRAWQQWRWETPNASAEPSGTSTSDGDKAADQLAAYMPPDVYAQAVAEGALGWSLYMFTWSDQDPVPVVAVRVGSRTLDLSKPYSTNSWLRATPMMADAGDQTAPLPTKSTRRNYTLPSSGGQGIVAADRMVMVYDPVDPAVIRWTGNQQGNYIDFTAGRGGGYKTLTSGNLMVPACVKLWQNPQSVDTLTILCMGVDGMSTGYYMAPAQVASQNEAVNVMGFEETTATPGTCSPFGVEVMNNALYHPLDEQLMKSTATSYNINHSSVTDQIQDVWRGLANKQWIVSSVCDNRIYYLVYNPLGDPLEDRCKGNEVWVFDGAQKAGSWSRWKTQGVSLRKIEQGGRVGMSLIRPDGIYFFDDSYDQDDYVNGGVVDRRPIPWFLETNTQGANRAHDAWAHVQQVSVVLGNFTGQLRYGIRGLDVHGKYVDVSKVTRDSEPGTSEAYDIEDFLQVRRDLKEWFFYAGSVEDGGVVQHSAGQINLVQYRYTPSTVNTGYEFGSVETFEYGRSAQPADNRTSTNGVPMPYVDTRRP